MSTHQPTEPLAPVDQQPVLGLHGEPCASCGAPLAADQRYCLSCGNRRAGSRLPFRDILAEPAGDVAPPAPSSSPAASADTGRGGTIAALAGLAVILLALGMGVLIGHAGQDATPADTTPQVINVGGATATPAGAAAAGAAAGAGAAAKSSKAAGTKKSSSSSGAATGATKAKNTKLKELEKLSPQEYQKQSRKLPKTVGTGGAPPPKDNKPAAGGGDFETIG